MWKLNKKVKFLLQCTHCIAKREYLCQLEWKSLHFRHHLRRTRPEFLLVMMQKKPVVCKHVIGRFSMTICRVEAPRTVYCNNSRSRYLKQITKKFNNQSYIFIIYSELPHRFLYSSLSHSNQLTVCSVYVHIIGLHEFGERVYTFPSSAPDTSKWGFLLQYKFKWEKCKKLESHCDVKNIGFFLLEKLILVKGFLHTHFTLDRQ